MVSLDLSLQDLNLLVEIWNEMLLRIRHKLLHLSIVLLLLVFSNLRLKFFDCLFCLRISLWMRDLLVLLVDLLLVKDLSAVFSFLFPMLTLGELGTRLLWLWLLLLLILLRLSIVVVICFYHLVLLQDGEVALGLRGTLLHLLDLLNLLYRLLLDLLMVLTHELGVSVLQVVHIMLSAIVLRLFISLL